MVRAERRSRSATRAAAASIALCGWLTGCSNPDTAGAALTTVANPPAVDNAVRATPVVPGRRSRVFVFAGVGKKCEPVAAPVITIVEPPQKGEVALVPGQETTMQYAAGGTCSGARAVGTGIYYTARDGQQGADRFSVSAKLASGETATRTFDVRIAE